MNKEFDKYRTIGPDYHYRQIDRWSFRNYNASVEARFRKLVEKVKEAGDRKLKLLDVGCGNGVALYLIEKVLPSIELYGLDPAEEALEEARARLPRAHLSLGASESLPFADDTFDLVISSDVIEHVKDAEKMLEEIKRVSKGGARVLVSTPVRRTKYPIDPHHVQEFFTEDFLEMMSRYFRDCKLWESHNLIPTLLYNAPTKSFLNWRYAINLLSLAGFNPFLAGRQNASQMFAYMYVSCRK